MIFQGDGRHPPLAHREVVVVQPLQLTPRRFALVAYVMTYDVTRPIAAERYRLTIGGISGKAAVELYDPHQDAVIAVESCPCEAGERQIVVPLVDHPRLVMLSE